MANKATKKGDWIEKAREDLDKLTKEQLVEKIIQKRKETFSKTGKRNVATSKTHERRCKKLLTEWSGVEFRRRRIEGRGDDVTVVEGVADIIPVEGQVIFAIESKKGENFSLDGLFVNPKGAKFTEWWHQVNYDAKLLTEKLGEKRWPLLFFKPIPAWDWVAVPSKCFDDKILIPKDESLRNLYMGCWFQHIRYDCYKDVGLVEHNISTSKSNPVMEALELEPCIMCRWKDFAREVDPQAIFVQN
jgi:hypothetical protein